MDLCTTRYVIFIDDDVAITRSTVDAIRGALILGNEIVGVRLLPPPGLPLNKWYISPCQFHYLGLHRNDAPGKTWGACMAFNLDFVRKHALEFRGELGRLRHNLVSGDDTTFILEVKQAGGREQFLDHAHAYHHVSLERLKITSMVYRALWQGRSEVLRENIWQGLWKEWDRNTGGERIGPLGWGLAVLYQSMVTLGVIIELVARLRSLWTNHTYRSMRRQRLKTSATDCAPIAQSTTSQTPVLRLQLLSWLRIILREQRQPTHNSTVWSEIPHDGKEKAVGRD